MGPSRNILEGSGEHLASALAKVMELAIISPCFYPNNEPASLMVQSARAHNLTVVLYGVGEDFIPHGADAQVKRLHELMAPECLAEYALITDCRDVLFLANQDEITRKFLSFGSDLVMSTENGCWPSDPEVVAHFHGKNRNGYDFINAGQYIGKWSVIVNCLRHLLSNYRKGDGLDNSQGWWAQAHMRGELPFALDYECTIFQTMSGGADVQVKLEDGRFINSLTGEQPCSIHCNGNPNTKEPHRELWKLVSST